MKNIFSFNVFQGRRSIFVLLSQLHFVLTLVASFINAQKDRKIMCNDYSPSIKFHEFFKWQNLYYQYVFIFNVDKVGIVILPLDRSTK